MQKAYLEMLKQNVPRNLNIFRIIFSSLINWEQLYPQGLKDFFNRKQG